MLREIMAINYFFYFGKKINVCKKKFYKIYNSYLLWNLNEKEGCKK